MNKDFINYIHVAVGVVFNQRGEILVALRPHHLHQGGLWEFPGGKVESNETIEDALKRELLEEVGIEIITAKPLTILPYHYSEKKVLLDVWQVTEFSGEAHGREGQQVRWVSLTELSSLQVPAANQGIIETVLKVCGTLNNTNL